MKFVIVPVLIAKCNLCWVASREREIEVGCGGRGCGSKPELRRGIKEFENEKRRVQEELRM
jgi:hypothetical protein